MDLFLIIKVNRNNLVSDSMNEIAKKKADLKKKLRVFNLAFKMFILIKLNPIYSKITFIGEAAIDMGN